MAGNGKRVVAYYDYEASQSNDLSFRQGDTLEVLRREGGWWYALNLRTNNKGFVPSTYFIDDSEAPGDDDAATLYIALHAWAGDGRSQLSLEVGQLVEVFGECIYDIGWLQGRHLGSQLEPPGLLLPASYVTPALDAPWYHGAVSRHVAEVLLMAPGNPPGTFLVRTSTSSAYTLSVYSGSMYHFKIYRDEAPTRYRISKDVRRGSVQDLITHYMHHPVTSTCGVLTKACVKSTESDDRKQWAIPRDSIKLTTKLGGGQFGDVWKGTWNNVEVAVKMLKKNCTEDDKEALGREAQLMKKIRHPRVVKMFGMSTDSDYLLVMELVGKGSLESILRSRNASRNPLEVRQLVQMARQVASGMRYLAAEKCIHRDLAARNVLVTHDMDVKIADFGLSRLIKSNVYNQSTVVKLPVKWMAPEVVISNLYTSQSDVWSFAMLLYEMFAQGGEPYPGMSSMDARDAILNKTVVKNNPRPPACPTQVYDDLMLHCWNTKPDDRPDFIQLHDDLKALEEKL